MHCFLLIESADKNWLQVWVSKGKRLTHIALDLFSGHGWGVAMEKLGIHEYSVDIMPEVHETRALNGMKAVSYKDVWDYNSSVKLAFDTLIASPPCFTAGAPVLTERGVVAIEEVVVGDKVLTHKGRWRKVTQTMNRMAETVTFGNITCTPDHPFYVSEQVHRFINKKRVWNVENPSWVDAKDTHGKFLSIPVTAVGDYQEDVPLSWWLIGRWLADGWGQPARYEICIAVGNKKIEEFEKQIDETWRIYETNRGVRRYTKYDKDAITWLVDTFNSGAENKTLPGWILNMPFADRQELLKGYLSGDGTVSQTGWKANGVSLNLMSGIRLLADSLGYTTSLVHVKTSDTTVIEGRTVNQRNYWTININQNNNRHSRTDNLHRWVKQRKKVVESGIQRVYDITVEEDHSFVCWNFVVHNCQSYSASGNGHGRKALNDVIQLIHDGDYRDIDGLRQKGQDMGDERTALVLAPLHYIDKKRPDYIALEQVIAVQPVWEVYAEVLRSWGYHVWTGILKSEQYGVAQTRKRSILLARKSSPIDMPIPSHSAYNTTNPYSLDPGVPSWVSIHDVLGDIMIEKTGELAKYFKMSKQANQAIRAIDTPAPTMAFGNDYMSPRWASTFEDAKAWGHRPAKELSDRLQSFTQEQAGLLQSYPAGFVFSGNKFSQYKQIANSVPPLMAEKILRHLWEIS